MTGSPAIGPLPHVELVALATIADLVTLSHHNRVLVRRGLDALPETDNAGLRALMQVARVRGPVTPGHIGFTLAPRINAAGRVGGGAPRTRPAAHGRPERGRPPRGRAGVVQRRAQDDGGARPRGGAGPAGPILRPRARLRTGAGVARLAPGGDRHRGLPAGGPAAPADHPGLGGRRHRPRERPLHSRLRHPGRHHPGSPSSRPFRRTPAGGGDEPGAGAPRRLPGVVQRSRRAGAGGSRSAPAPRRRRRTPPGGGDGAAGALPAAHGAARHRQPAPPLPGARGHGGRSGEGAEGRPPQDAPARPHGGRWNAIGFGLAGRVEPAKLVPGPVDAVFRLKLDNYRGVPLIQAELGGIGPSRSGPATPARTPVESPP